MSGQAMGQGASSAAISNPPARVTADSFRSLTQRLKSSQLTAQPAPLPPAVPEILVVQSQPVVEVRQQVSPSVEVAPPEPEHISAPVIVDVPVPAEPPVPPPVEIELSPALEPPVEVEEPEAATIAVAAEPAIEEQPAQAPVPEVDLQAAPMPRFVVIAPAAMPDIENAIPATDIDILDPVAAVPPAGINPDRINFVLGRSSPPSVMMQDGPALPPILPPPEPPKPSAARPSLDLNIDIDQEVRRINAEVRRRKDNDLENITRMIMTPPSLEERAEYLEEAARLAAQEEAEQAMQAHGPAEDLEALAREHMAKFGSAETEAPDLPPPDEMHAAPAAMPEPASAEDVQSAGVFEVAQGEADSIEHEAEIVAASVEHELEMLSPADVIENPVSVEAQVSIAPPVTIEDIVAPLPVAPMQTPAPIPESVLELESEPEPELAPELAPEPATAQPEQHRARRVEQQPAAAGAVHEAVAKMSENQVADLARSLLDMMASGSNAGLPQERALASDTLLRILPRMPMRALVQLSERLSMMEAPPHMIVGKILQDERIEVSGPLIENAVVIGERELLDLIAASGQEKLRLVARRRKLTRTITNEIVARGNPSVHLTLVRNATAELTHEGFLALTEAAKTEPDLLAPLCTRADLPAPQAFELFWQSPPQLRRYLLSRFLTDSETLTRILRITLATQGGEHAGDEIANPQQVNAALAHLSAGEEQDAVVILAELARVAEETVQRICEDRSGEPLIVLLKLLGIPRNSLIVELHALQNSDFGVLDQSRDVQELQAMFDTLSYNKARILITYWDWAVQKTGPYAPAN